jgi:phosphoglycolate phosphatase
MDINDKTIDLKGVLFDLDGTLIDSKLDIAAAANAARAHFKMPPLPAEDVLPFIGFGIRHLIGGALETSWEARIDEGLKAALIHYDSHLGEQTTVFEGALELLKDLKGRGIICGVVSNKPHDLTLRTLKIFKMEGYFRAALGEGAVRNKKPHPEPVREALRRMQVKPENAVFVGDSAVDVQTARNAGIPVIVVSHGFGEKDALEQELPDLTVPSLKDLAGILK